MSKYRIQTKYVKDRIQLRFGSKEERRHYCHLIYIEKHVLGLVNGGLWKRIEEQYPDDIKEIWSEIHLPSYRAYEQQKRLEQVAAETFRDGGGI